MGWHFRALSGTDPFVIDQTVTVTWKGQPRPWVQALLAEAGEHARRFQPARATGAHLLDRLGRTEEAVAAYQGAISLTHDTAERQYLEHRRDRASRPDQ